MTHAHIYLKHTFSLKKGVKASKQYKYSCLKRMSRLLSEKSVRSS